MYHVQDPTRSRGEKDSMAVSGNARPSGQQITKADSKAVKTSTHAFWPEMKLCSGHHGRYLNPDSY